MLSKMRQYTNKSQTAKLIELGFEGPKSIEEFLEPENDWSIGGLKQRKAYSIGELIEMLPISFEIENDITVWLEIEAGIGWSVLYSYCGFAEYECEGKELIDALFDMILKLKKEGVI
jgi:hypothetical protein